MLLKNISEYSGIYLACGVTDLRKSVDGLAHIVKQAFEMDPFENYLFLFCNKLRRKWNDAMPKTDHKGTTAFVGLEFCQKLFALEDSFQNLSAEERLILRHERSKPVLDDYFAWVETLDPLAASKLVEAITYSKNQREPLSAFLLDGRVEISNNRAENAIRPFAVGRKNWMFSDTVGGAQASALAYSIIETAKANGLNPFQYLLHLFEKLPSILTKNPTADLSPFFPWLENIQTKCRFSQSHDGQLRL